MATTQQQTIRRGTTPDIVINVNKDLTGAKVELAIESGGYQIIHTTDDALDVSVSDGECTLHTKLSQEETLALKANSKVSLQLRVYDNGNAKASEIITLGVDDIVRNGKIS